ncbi:hypothetical protein INR49_017424 [Caranx melampygus]|nr:hypothetical protein INR49_017424 [Caranx melampygus]
MTVKLELMVHIEPSLAVRAGTERINSDKQSTRFFFKLNPPVSQVTEGYFEEAGSRCLRAPPTRWRLPVMRTWISATSRSGAALAVTLGFTVNTLLAESASTESLPCVIHWRALRMQGNTSVSELFRDRLSWISSWEPAVSPCCDGGANSSRCPGIHNHCMFWLFGCEGRNPWLKKTHAHDQQPPSINLPEVLSEEFLPNGLPVDSDPLPDLHQVWGTATKEGVTHCETGSLQEASHGLELLLRMAPLPADLLQCTGIGKSYMSKFTGASQNLKHGITAEV